MVVDKRPMVTDAMMAELAGKVVFPGNSAQTAEAFLYEQGFEHADVAMLLICAEHVAKATQERLRGIVLSAMSYPIRR